MLINCLPLKLRINPLLTTTSDWNRSIIKRQFHLIVPFIGFPRQREFPINALILYETKQVLFVRPVSHNNVCAPQRSPTLGLRCVVIIENLNLITTYRLRPCCMRPRSDPIRFDPRGQPVIHGWSRCDHNRFQYPGCIATDVTSSVEIYAFIVLRGTCLHIPN